MRGKVLSAARRPRPHTFPCVRQRLATGLLARWKGRRQQGRQEGVGEWEKERVGFPPAAATIPLQDLALTFSFQPVPPSQLGFPLPTRPFIRSHLQPTYLTYSPASMLVRGSTLHRGVVTRQQQWSSPPAGVDRSTGRAGESGEEGRTGCCQRQNPCSPVESRQASVEGDRPEVCVCTLQGPMLLPLLLLVTRCRTCLNVRQSFPPAGTLPLY